MSWCITRSIELCSRFSVWNESTCLRRDWIQKDGETWRGSMVKNPQLYKLVEQLFILLHHCATKFVVVKLCNVSHLRIILLSSFTTKINVIGMQPLRTISRIGCNWQCLMCLIFFNSPRRVLNDFARDKRYTVTVSNRARSNGHKLVETSTIRNDLPGTMTEAELRGNCCTIDL